MTGERGHSRDGVQRMGGSHYYVEWGLDGPPDVPCYDTRIRVFAMCMNIAKSLVGILPFIWLLEIIVVPINVKFFLSGLFREEL